VPKPKTLFLLNNFNFNNCISVSKLCGFIGQELQSRKGTAFIACVAWRYSVE